MQIDMNKVRQPWDADRGFVDQEIEPTVNLLFPQNAGLKDLPLVETLKNAVKVCEGILEAFATLQPSEERPSDFSGDAGGQVEPG
jgi:hypothetical protein